MSAVSARPRPRHRVRAAVLAAVATIGATASAAAAVRPVVPAPDVTIAAAGEVRALPDPVVPAAVTDARVNAAIDRALADQPPVYVADDGEIISVERVRAFLARKGSPLERYAEDFVTAGASADVDPRVVIAIAAAESTYGKRQLGHNAWGWGASTTARMQRWPDWPTAIHEYTAALGQRYDTDAVDEAFARRYVPPNWRWWLRTVRAVMAEI